MLHLQKLINHTHTAHKSSRGEGIWLAAPIRTVTSCAETELFLFSLLFVTPFLPEPLEARESSLGRGVHLQVDTHFSKSIEERLHLSQRENTGKQCHSLQQIAGKILEPTQVPICRRGVDNHMTVE